MRWLWERGRGIRVFRRNDRDQAKGVWKKHGMVSFVTIFSLFVFGLWAGWSWRNLGNKGKGFPFWTFALFERYPMRCLDHEIQRGAAFLSLCVLYYARSWVSGDLLSHLRDLG